MEDQKQEQKYTTAEKIRFYENKIATLGSIKRMLDKQIMYATQRLITLKQEGEKEKGD